MSLVSHYSLQVCVRDLGLWQIIALKALLACLPFEI